MAAEIISVAQGSVTGGTSYDVAAPASGANGDILLLLHAQSVGNNPTLPSGFAVATISTQKFQGSTAAAFSTSAPTGGGGVYYKEITDHASEPATYTVTLPSSGNGGGVLLRIRGLAFQRGVASAIRSEFMFDGKRNLQRSGSQIVEGNGPLNAMDLSYDQTLVVAAWVQNVAGVTATLSSPPASMTQRGTLIALDGVSLLVATELLDMATKPDPGSMPCTTDQASGTGRGYIVAIGDEVDKRVVGDLHGAGVSSDATPPTISNVTPASGTELASRTTPIAFRVTDATPGLRAVVISCRYASIPGTFVVHNGSAFVYPFDSGTSARAVVANGYDFTILPRGGWPDDVAELFVYAVDQSGNLEGSLP